jgi:hypothetical protein
MYSVQSKTFQLLFVYFTKLEGTGRNTPRPLKNCILYITLCFFFCSFSDTIVHISCMSVHGSHTHTLMVGKLVCTYKFDFWTTLVFLPLLPRPAVCTMCLMPYVCACTQLTHSTSGQSWFVTT